jgi:glutathione synthase/RimK-type ligase-like ATP-grasp enzyme/gamma-glutamyl:cysteine ligase YbdK (ATP-grasp superfamily)
LSRGRVLVVVSVREDAAGLPDALVVTAQTYIESGGAAAEPGTLVLNLCRTLGYGSDGYYVSLLADARGQQVLPRLETSAGIADPYARFRALQESGIATLDEAELAVRRRAAGARQAAAAAPRTTPADDAGLGGVPLLRDGHRYREARPGEYRDVVVCMGATTAPQFGEVAARVYRVWPAPLLQMRLLHEDGLWKVAGLAHASPAVLDAAQRALLAATVTRGLRALRKLGAAVADPRREAVRASIAVLLDARDPFSASSPETVERLAEVAARMNVHVARIGATDLRRLPEYDALFIRSLTGVSLPSFQFALRAEALDMPVVDDSQSIIRCGNKVFLEELLRREGVPLPRTLIVTAHTAWQQLEELGLPFVIKSPDGSFSAGVHRIDDRADYDMHTRALLKHSPLLIAQEWLPTDFDWRVTVLDGRLLFAARYYMAHGHWQIRSDEGGVERYGKVEAVPRAAAPAHVVEVALHAARLIGRGMYGVDLKETATGPVVIEVNDNPNLDAGYEDTADGDVIYEEIIAHFLRLVEAGTAGGGAGAGAGAGAGGGVRRSSAGLLASQRPAGLRRAVAAGHEAFAVAGLELEYPTVDADLNVVALVEPAFRAIAGRGTSDIELDRVGFSNEIADHVFEVKTLEPTTTLREAEAIIVDGIGRFTEVLRREWNARLLPTGMHPWFDPHDGRLWTRSGLRIYTTYAHVFNVRTHGWMNVHATHLNLPFGNERETMAMHSAAAMLLPYLPAVAASTPVHDGSLQPYADARLAWLLRHQARIPETCGRMVPEYVDSFAGYRRDILRPMYAALDRHSHSEAIRREFLNGRGAVLRFGRRALELRVLDTQECVRMDAAIAAFARAALRELTRELLEGVLEPPPHDALVADFAACIRDGTAALVRAPHLAAGGAEVPVRDVLRLLLERAHRGVTAEDAGYLDLVDAIIEHGTLAERIRARLELQATATASAEERRHPDAVRHGLRTVYGELAECLARNEPWSGRR